MLLKLAFFSGSFLFVYITKESTVHRLKTLDILIGMAKKKGRRESIMAVGKLCFCGLVNN